MSLMAPVPAVPDIPPLAQMGIPGYDVGGWHMLLPPRTRPSKSSTGSIPS